MSEVKHNGSLHSAKRDRNDEFYTRLPDIENELKHYREHFTGKVVYCNCDDPKVSNFFFYFSRSFHVLGIKKLIATCYKNTNSETFSKNESDSAVYIEYNGDLDENGEPTNLKVTPLNSDGDFRSPECIELLKQADIVVTNPPFSLFREFVALLMEFDKKFLIIGSQNAFTYKEIFPLIMSNRIWVGNNNVKKFRVPLENSESVARKNIVVENGEAYATFGNICWFTNLDISKRHDELILFREYNDADYPKFDFYDAINVNKVSDIPVNYTGAMGVPITFLDKYNPEQFEILNANDFRLTDTVPIKAHGLIKDKDGAINGKPTYARILIRNKAI